MLWFNRSTKKLVLKILQKKGEIASVKTDIEIAQIKKLRRRVEEFLRKGNITILIKVADLLGVKVQKGLEKYRK